MSHSICLIYFGRCFTESRVASCHPYRKWSFAGQERQPGGQFYCNIKHKSHIIDVYSSLPQLFSPESTSGFFVPILKRLSWSLYPDFLISWKTDGPFFSGILILSQCYFLKQQVFFFHVNMMQFVFSESAFQLCKVYDSWHMWTEERVPLPTGAIGCLYYQSTQTVGSLNWWKWTAAYLKVPFF